MHYVVGRGCVFYIATINVHCVLDLTSPRILMHLH